MDSEDYDELAKRMLNEAFAFVDDTLRFSRSTKRGEYLLPLDREALERNLLVGHRESYDRETLREYLNVHGQEDFLLSIQPWIALVVNDLRQARGL